jgi:esterase/lipase
LLKQTDANKRYIFCFLFKPAIPFYKLVIYFHGNGETVANSVAIGKHFTGINFGVLAVEYPGYSYCPGEPSEQTVYQDAEAVYQYCIHELKIN